jgi:hypothetical protein
MRIFFTTILALCALSTFGVLAQDQKPSPANPDRPPAKASQPRSGGRGDPNSDPRPERRDGDARPDEDRLQRSGGSARSGGQRREGPPLEPGAGAEGGARGFGGGFGKMPGGPPQGFGEGGGFGGGMRGSGGFGGGMGGMRGGYGSYGSGGEGPPDDPEMRDLMKQDADLDRQTHETAVRMREARGEDRAKLKSQLADMVNKHFDIRQKRRELQLKRMEEELQRLRDAIAKRNTSRDSIVENHLRELTGEPRDLDF